MQLFGPVNIAMFDWPWSGIHFLSGLVIGVIFVLANRRRPWRSSILLGLFLLILWECFEGFLRYMDLNHHAGVLPLKTALDGAFFDIESWANLIGDIIIGMVGITLVRAAGSLINKKAGRP